MAAHSLRVTKNHFRVLRQWGRDPRAQVMFSSILPVEDSNAGRSSQIESIHIWLCGWCHCKNFGFFDEGKAYAASDGTRLSQ